MKLSGNTILITGGATGIGLELAKRLVALGNEVIICGRREEKLNEAKKMLPAVHTKKCDISKKSDRESLFEWVKSNFGGINVLVNNAGIQRRVNLKEGAKSIDTDEDEFDINFKSQVYLSAMFIPVFSKKENSAIINVSSGLGFVPLAIFPIYSATKAAIHSFTMSLRHQLKGTKISVFEVIPPTVYDTELKGRPIEKTNYTISASEVIDATIKGLENDTYEIAMGPAKRWVEATKQEKEDIFNQINH